MSRFYRQPSCRGALVFVAALGVLAGLVPLRAAHAQAGDVSAADATAAIDDAVAYLKRMQRVDGTWVEYTGIESGTTALCTLALLNAGVPADDAAVKRAVNYLRNDAPLNKTYAVSLQLMVFTATKDEFLLGEVQKRADWLVKAQQQNGSWSYDQGRTDFGDNSNSQFALLALHEAEQFSADVRIDDRVWLRSLSYWQQCQNFDGSWGYRSRGDSTGTGSMTCAGISSMYICASKLADVGDLDPNRLCCRTVEDDPLVAAARRSVDQGLNWLGGWLRKNNGSLDINPGGGASWVLYYLYGLERAGRLTAQRFVGGYDWYRVGTRKLVREQGVGGWWQTNTESESGKNIGTSLSLLFLAKGRRPLLMGKVVHDGNWNNHPDDTVHLTQHVERVWKRDLTWQVIDVEAATAEDLAQLPVLYFSGSEAFSFNAATAKKLRAYIDQGGFIFAEDCCNKGGPAFEQSFRKLIKEIFPEEQYSLSLLPPTHPLWRVEVEVAPDFINRKVLWGVNASCRTSVVFSTTDLSCAWNYANYRRRKKLRELDDVGRNFLNEMETALDVGLNVLSYATNRQVRYKYEAFDETNTEISNDPFGRGQLFIAEVVHAGGAEAAKSALPNLRTALAQLGDVRVNLEGKKYPLADVEIFNFPILFMHGRTNFQLGPQERKNLKLYCENGGVLVADAVCGSRAFAKAFREEIEATFPDAKLEPIPPEHPIFSEKYGGKALDSVKRRDPQIADTGVIKNVVRNVPPTLEGLKIGERYVVLFSPYDMSCALEQQGSVECPGYLPEDALALAIKCIYYALNQPGP